MNIKYLREKKGFINNFNIHIMWGLVYFLNHQGVSRLFSEAWRAVIQ